MKKYIGITILTLGFAFLIWSYFFKNEMSKTGIALAFFAIAAGARFMRVSYE